MFDCKFPLLNSIQWPITVPSHIGYLRFKWGTLIKKTTLNFSAFVASTDLHFKKNLCLSLTGCL